MDELESIGTLSALAQPTRLAAFRVLMRAEPHGLAQGLLAEQLHVPQNTLSNHLNILAHAGLVRSERQGRMVVYRAVVAQIQALSAFLIDECCTMQPHLCKLECSMPHRPYNVLFLCTGNTARSVLAESILRFEGLGKFNAFSAGSQPKGVVNPFALKTLERMGYPTNDLRSKSWSEFEGETAPHMDFIFTVCDDAAGEACPFWAGHPVTAHWGIADPAVVEGTDIEKERAFSEAFRLMKNRILAFVALPFASLDKLALGHELHAIGQMDGATSGKQA